MVSDGVGGYHGRAELELGLLRGRDQGRECVRVEDGSPRRGQKWDGGARMGEGRYRMGKRGWGEGVEGELSGEGRNDGHR
jgi:hypothetical protein